jgi:hypothetical protein
VAAALLWAMVGLSPLEAVGGGCGHTRKRLGPFSLDNVTAGRAWEQRPWPRGRARSRRAERPSVGTPTTGLKNHRIHRNSFGGGFCGFCGF